MHNEQKFNLEEYLSNGVENIVRGAIKSSLENSKESIFIAKFVLSSKKARKIRIFHEKRGEHIPPFLIASITSSCNLHCTGCYARENNSCGDYELKDQLTAAEWGKVFHESTELGINFILLAGGEPLIRYDIIKTAANFENIIFPIFTNGTMINEQYITLFDKNRNLVPILSMEGDAVITDNRRGYGVYSKLISSMEDMYKKCILFGTSITLTKENINNVTNEKFISELYDRGCKVVIYVEYVPVNSETRVLAPTEEDRNYLDNKIGYLRQRYNDMIFISFPGDEKSSGGCLAAGRGFFHINSHGGAEPCPFSPYSDTNIKESSLLEAVKSPLFAKLKDNNMLLQEHVGGCVLFEKEEEVKNLCC